MTIWFDVEDLFEYARSLARPSGIQRLSYEVYAALVALAPEQVGFVRHDMLGNTLRTVPWREVDAIYAKMTQGVLHDSSAAVDARGPTPLMHTAFAKLPALRALAQRMPREVRQPLREAIRAQISVGRNLGRATRATFSRQPAETGASGALAAAAAASESPSRREDLRAVAKPGDVLACFGSPWSLPDYAALVTKYKEAAGLRFAMLCYDLIPMIRPEFCDRGLVMMFSAFMRECLPLADVVLTISEATVRDVVRWSERAPLRLAAKPKAIPIGTGFSSAAHRAAELPEGIVPGEYALFVSTVEARKNHVLAFRAWRHLLDAMPADKVPKLVFAGRIGWMVSDLMQQIFNAEHLGGKLCIVENPDDGTLAALYAGARFTLFPSLYEGWGLPVSESLAFGKVCLASNGTSVPEAGGAFCLYHDPESVTDAVALYRRAIEEPELVTKLEARIAAEYRPVAWSDSARAVLEALA